jgi:hypothetical protein
MIDNNYELTIGELDAVSGGHWTSGGDGVMSMMSRIMQTINNLPSPIETPPKPTDLGPAGQG